MRKIPQSSWRSRGKKVFSLFSPHRKLELLSNASMFSFSFHTSPRFCFYFDCWLHFRAHESFYFSVPLKAADGVFGGRKTPEIQPRPRHVALTIQNILKFPLNPHAAARMINESWRKNAIDFMACLNLQSRSLILEIQLTSPLKKTSITQPTFNLFSSVQI